MKFVSAIGASIFLVLLSSLAVAQPVAVTKSNPMPIYMHYMPWFETPDTLGGDNWGFHWKFDNQNPNIINPNGQRQIASHFYPLIGPYASSDPAVIEYHMLLMKYSGVDGILLDWYGTQGSNDDVGSLLNNSNAAIAKVDDFGLKFGVMFEDRYSRVSRNDPTPDISKAMTNMAYLRDNYFNNPSYIRQGADNAPLVDVFGPNTFHTQSEWTQILSQAGEHVDLNTLWYASNEPGTNATGEFGWIDQDVGTNNHLALQSAFYHFRAPEVSMLGGVAYPGFDDFYEEGGLGPIIDFTIPHNNGQTLADVLDVARQNSGNMDYLQLATFNDFGEGTMFEPTVQTGFDYLKQLQAFTGVSYGEAELQLVYQLYLARKQYAGNASAQLLLDQVSAELAALQVDEAARLLQSVPEPSTWAFAIVALAALVAVAAHGAGARSRSTKRLSSVWTT